MIFFCFSSKDRQVIVEAILYHITNYGIPVWYDRKKMLLGDNRNLKNFVEGVGKCNYAIVVMSKNAFTSSCVKEEMLLIEEKYHQGSMHVFPIFFDISLDAIPSDYCWLLNLVYKEISPKTDVRGTCNHIVCKYLLDKLAPMQIHKLSDIEMVAFIRQTFPFICELVKDYTRIDNSNLDAKVALLYAGCKYAITILGSESIPHYCSVGVDRIFSETSLHLPIDLRETLIIERFFLILINAILQRYGPEDSRD